MYKKLPQFLLKKGNIYLKNIYIQIFSHFLALFKQNIIIIYLFFFVTRKKKKENNNVKTPIILNFILLQVLNFEQTKNYLQKI